MRSIISKEEAKRIIDTIPSIHVKTYNNRATSELVDIYKIFIRSYNCVDLIKLTMSINAKKQMMTSQKHKFGVVDERYMKRAEDLLFGELAAALEIPKKNMPDYIANRVCKEWRE